MKKLYKTTSFLKGVKQQFGCTCKINVVINERNTFKKDQRIQIGEIHRTSWDKLTASPLYKKIAKHTISMTNQKH